MTLRQRSEPEIGGVYVPRSMVGKRGCPRYVVYLVKANDSVFFDALNKTPYASAGACCGPGASSRFLSQYEKVGQMTFGGAWKRYQQERRRKSA